MANATPINSTTQNTAFTDEQNVNLRYGYENALYDAVMSKLSQRGWMPRVDPFTFGGSDAVAMLRRGITVTAGLTARTPAHLFSHTRAAAV